MSLADGAGTPNARRMRSDRSRIGSLPARWRRLALVVVGASSIISSGVAAQASLAGAPGSGSDLAGPVTPLPPPPAPTPMAAPRSASTTLAPVPAQATTSPPPTPSTTDTPISDTFTSFSHTVHNRNGTYTSEFNLTPAYRKVGGAWVAIDSTVKPFNVNQPFAAENAFRPIRFGVSSADLVELVLDKGPVVLSASGLLIGVPSQSQNGVSYTGVAADTNLRYQVTPAGVFEQIVLNSDHAPTSYTFHLSDPTGQLGNTRLTQDGGLIFDAHIDGGIGFKIEPPNAYETNAATGESGAPQNPGSAHQTVTPSGDGYDITESIDPSWLKGKTFPIVLDPTVTLMDDQTQGVYNAQYAMAMRDKSLPNGCDSSCGSTDDGVDLGVGSYYPYVQRESFFQYNLGAANPPIPTGSTVNSVTFEADISGCWIGQTNPCNPGPSSTYAIGLAEMRYGWSPGGHWDGMDSNMDHNPDGTIRDLLQLNQQVSKDPYPGGYIPWTDINSANFPTFRTLVQQWFDGTLANNGFGLHMFNSSPCPWNGGVNVCGGPAFQNNTPTPYNCTANCSPAQCTPTPGTACTSQGHSPQLIISYTPPPPPSPPTITKSIVNPQAVYSKGQVVTYSITANNPTSSPINVSDVTDALPAGLAAVDPRTISAFPPATSVVTLNNAPCPTSGAGIICTLTPTQFSTNGFQLGASASVIFTFPAVVISALDRACSQVSNTAHIDASSGSATSLAVPLTICDVGLGYENWWSYVNQDLGAGGKASVNVANGNLVVQVTDSTPVQAHGRFAYVLRRTYNSQDTGNVLPLSVLNIADPTPIGVGWRLNVDQVGNGVGDGVVPDSLLVPSAQSVVDSAFAVTLVDEDGTHHVFTPNALTVNVGANVQLNPVDVTPGSIPSTSDLFSLASSVITGLSSGYDHLCVDETFNSPAGVHLSLWRYLEVKGQCTAPQSSPSPLVVGFAAMRPDRVRYEFSLDGHLLTSRDGAGVQLTYNYANQTTGLPVTLAVGHLNSVDEARSCTGTPGSASCRAFVFSYPSLTQTVVTDPGGRTSQYLLCGDPNLTSTQNANCTSNELVEVKNVPANTSYTYSYGAAAGCPTPTSTNHQLCSASDLSGNATYFAYAVPASGLGLPQATKIIDRLGHETDLSYTHPSQAVPSCGSTTGDYVTAIRYTAGNPVGEEQRFSCFDSKGDGTVGEIDQGGTDNNFRHQTLSRWDTQSGVACIQQPSSQQQSSGDRNLCRSFRYAGNGTATAQDTSYTYNPEGQLLVQATCLNASDPSAGVYPPASCPSTPLSTTYGNQAEYCLAASCGQQAMTTASDAVAGNGQVTSQARPTGPAVYVVSDKTQSLTPRGNQAGGSFAQYETHYADDSNASTSPNAMQSGGFCVGTSTNSGLLCSTTGPTYDGSHATVTSYQYDTNGQKTRLVNPNGNAYTYTYYADTDTDLSGLTQAGGWLKAVTDPMGNFVVDAYDQAGHRVRTWDRNATHADPMGNAYTVSQFPGIVTAPTNNQYSETLYGSGSASSAFTAPWRYVLSARDPIGNVTMYTPDGNGNQTAMTTPKGNTTAQQFDAGDQLLSTTQPTDPVTGYQPLNTYAYDAFGNKTAMCQRHQNESCSFPVPTGVVTVFVYDTVNRLTTTEWTRNGWVSSDSTTYPACRQSTSADAPIAAGKLLCFNNTSFDLVDNKTASQDGNGQTTTYAYDGAHRLTQQQVPRNDGTLALLTTSTNYDADGNVTDVCPPRQYSEGGLAVGATCQATAAYGTHHTYDMLDRLSGTSTYRIMGSTTQQNTESFTHDADGNQIIDTNANGHATTAAYDALDRKTSLMVPRDASTSNSTHWLYDYVGNVTTVDQPDGPYTGTGASGPLVVDGSTNDASHPFKVPADANYTNVTLQNGGVISVDQYTWNPFGPPNESGILQLLATGTVNVCSTCKITVAGLGQGGGVGGSGGGLDCLNRLCHLYTPLAGRAGGGSGPGGGGSAGNIQGGPGGGGGHAYGGAGGIDPAWVSSGPADSFGVSLVGGPGIGGPSYGSAELGAPDITPSGMGSAGGGGGGDGYNNTLGLGRPETDYGGQGGAGGGVVRVAANSITLAGIIDASGADGASTTDAASPSKPVAGPGGGGSGGSIWLLAGSINLQPGSQLLARNGVGGFGTNTPGAGWTQGGSGSWGYARLDSPTLNNQAYVGAATFVQTSFHRYTDFSYDFDNRLLDTVQGADNPVAKQAGVASLDGGSDVRTRNAYDPDGNIVAQFDPRAFSASTTTPDATFMVRTDFNQDGRPIAHWVPRYDSGSHSDLGLSSTQTGQCPINPSPQTVNGVPGYPAGVGVCVTRVQYDGAGNRSKLNPPTSNGSDNRYAQYTYTDDNLVATVTAPSPLSDGSRVTRETDTYDADGQVIQQTDALGFSTTTQHNADESVAQVTGEPNPHDSVTHVTHYAYNAAGEPTSVSDPSGHTTTTMYFSDGLRRDVTDGAGDQTSYTYDNVGNPWQVTSPSANAKEANNTAGVPTVNTYTFDNLLQSTAIPFAPDGSSSYTTTYSYDPGGRKVSQHVALTSGGGSAINDGGTQLFGYYNDDRLSSQVGRDNGTITTQYDPAGNTKYTSSGGWSVTSTFYLDNLSRTVEDGTYTSQFAYDGSGSVAARSQLPKASGTSQTTTYSYSDAELTQSMASSVVGGGTTSYSYDQNGRPATETDPNGSQSLSWVFNPDNTLQKQTLSSGSTTLAQWTYANNADYLIQQQSFFGAAAGGGGTQHTAAYTFSYDGANRVNATYGSQNQNITWDHDGNRLTYTDALTGTPTSYKYNANDSIASQQVGSGSRADYNYDGTARLAMDSSSTYCYDGFDRLTAVFASTSGFCNGSGTQASYAYDPLDRRVTQIDNAGTTATHYDGLSRTVAVEATPTGTLAYELSSHGAHRALTSPSSGTQYLTDDGHGNISTVSPGGPTPSCSVRYDPFGNLIGSRSATNPCDTGVTANDIFYKDGRRDGSTGQYQMGSRVYDPSKGTFLTPDSYRTGTPAQNPSVGTDPLVANTYAYVNGDPVNLSDPSGHCASPCSGNPCEDGCPQSPQQPNGGGWGFVYPTPPGCSGCANHPVAQGQLPPPTDCSGLTAYFPQCSLVADVSGVVQGFQQMLAPPAGCFGMEQYTQGFGHSALCGAENLGNAALAIGSIAGAEEGGPEVADIGGIASRWWRGLFRNGEEAPKPHPVDGPPHVTPATMPTAPMEPPAGSLYHFGNAAGPRGARLSDFGVGGPGDLVGPFTPGSPLDEVRGASVSTDPFQSGLSGHYYSIPDSTMMPEGLGLQLNGQDMGGLMEWGHGTIYPTQAMPFEDFQSLFFGLPWEYAGKIR